jgi:hypothetical protein
MEENLRYWRGSAIAARQPQDVATHRYSLIKAFQLKAIPDFASGNFKSMEHLDPSGRVGFVVGLQKSLLKSFAYFAYTQMDETSEGVNFGYSLRLIYTPQKQRSTPSIQVYLLARVAGNDYDLVENIQKKQAKYIDSVLRSQLYQFSDKPDLKFEPTWLKTQSPPACYEIIKPEEVFQWLEADNKFFYSPGSWQLNKGNTMTALYEQLQSYDEPVCIDITLVPTRVTGSEQKTVSDYLGYLGDIAKGIPKEDVDPDSNSQKAKTTYEDIKKRYYSGNTFLYSFRVFSPDQDICQGVANQIAVTCSSNTNSPKICPVPNRQYAIQTALQVNINEQTVASGIWDENAIAFRAPSVMRRLHRIVDLDEASVFFRLPIPINQPCAGVVYDTGTSSQPEKDSGKTIDVGNYYRSTEECEFNIEKLKTHLLIVGGSGSGKTTTTFNLLSQLWGKHKIPFIVFDPKITPEYRFLKRLPEFQNDLLIFTPGSETVAPFRMNPFDVIDGVSLQEHISRLFDCFMGALSLDDPLPAFMQEAIDLNYEKYKWDIARSRGGDKDKEGNPLVAPTMKELFDKVLDIALKNYGNDKEVGDRIKGALRARLYRLTAKSGVGLMFEANRSIPMDLLMSKPIIFELGGLNQEEQALFSLFILSFVFEYVRSQRIGKFQPIRENERVTDLDLRHVILVEEAHNMLGNPAHSDKGGGASAKVVDKFAQIMREMRSAGEGVVIVDQSPAALAQSIVDATNLKLMHRLPSPDDREYLGRSMCLTEGEMQLSGIFSAGEAFYYVPGWDAAKRVQTLNFKAKESVNIALSTPYTDGEVTKVMESLIQQDRQAIVSKYESDIRNLVESVERLKQRQHGAGADAINASIGQKEKQITRLQQELNHLLGRED